LKLIDYAIEKESHFPCFLCYGLIMRREIGKNCFRFSTHFAPTAQVRQVSKRGMVSVAFSCRESEYEPGVPVGGDQRQAQTYVWRRDINETNILHRHVSMSNGTEAQLWQFY